MTRRIAIIDPLSSNRIRFGGELASARFEIDGYGSLGEARLGMARRPPDLVLIDFASEGEAFCTWLRDDPAMAGTLVIATGRFHTSEQRLAALRAGADDIFTLPGHMPLLLARIRSLLRSRVSRQDYIEQQTMCQALGLSEDGAEFSGASNILLVSERPSDLPAPLRGLVKSFGAQSKVTHLEDAETWEEISRTPDLILIDATATRGIGEAGSRSPRVMSELGLVANAPTDPGALFRLIAEIRATAEARHSGIVAVLPADTPDMAVMALDLGVDDIVTSDVTGEELLFRTRNLLDRKSREKRFRKTVKTGLEAAVTDPLTGLHNRRYALPQLDTLVEASKARPTGHVAALVIDIDHFKQVNDVHGHLAGDRVLTGVAERLSARLRAGEILARIGGEEFLVILPDTTPEAAVQTAERLRSEVAARPFGLGGAQKPGGGQGEIAVTISVGLALASGGGTGSTLFSRADAALYQAKAQGRNRVAIAPQSA